MKIYKKLIIKFLYNFLNQFSKNFRPLGRKKHFSLASPPKSAIPPRRKSLQIGIDQYPFTADFCCV
jgi:hypothetical protein